MTFIDVKVTIESQLGLIGGTMGLLTGFSILSGVEIVYFILRSRDWFLNFYTKPFCIDFLHLNSPTILSLKLRLRILNGLKVSVMCIVSTWFLLRFFLSLRIPKIVSAVQEKFSNYLALKKKWYDECEIVTNLILINLTAQRWLIDEEFVKYLTRKQFL